MNPADGMILFKEWLPDQPDLMNPGLTEAKNAIPMDSAYRSFAPLQAVVGATLNGRCQGALVQLTPPSSFTTFIGTGPSLYVSGSDKSAATYNTSSTGFWSFAVFKDKVIATNNQDLPQWRASSTTGNFTTLGSSSGTAPAAQHAGVIGQILILGRLGTTQKNFVRWSGIDQPLSWPTPNSATAIAQQSGQQEFSLYYGGVTGIVGGDQFGIIFQEGGIHRATYVGGGVVFQFDDIEAGRGCNYPNSIVRVGKLVYFISGDGFFATDGVSVRPVGKGKVDRYFNSTCDPTYRERVYGAVDTRKRVIYWGYPNTAASSGQPNNILLYNYEEDRWGRAENNHEALTTFGTLLQSFVTGVVAFGANATWGFFNGTPGAAVITSGEIEGNPGGFTRVSGIKPIVDVTVNALTVALGTRAGTEEAVTYTSETTANSRSRFADFRSEARYHRARLTISGTFNAAQGLQFNSEPSGDV